LCIERDLPRRLRTRDATIDSWLRERVRQIAAVFRSLKQWVSTPKPDTRGKFVEEIAHRLVCAASGDWDGLSKPAPEKLSAPQLRSRVLIVGRVLLAGALPGLVLWLLYQTRLAPHGDVAQYASVGVFIWAVVSVLSAFDPDFSTKASTVKEHVLDHILLLHVVPHIGRGHREYGVPLLREAIKRSLGTC
jgi:hypothetical protein